MEAEIKAETSGDLAKVPFFRLVKVPLPQVYSQVLAPGRGTRKGDVAADVDALYKAGVGKVGTDEAAFINVGIGFTFSHCLPLDHCHCLTGSFVGGVLCVRPFPLFVVCFCFFIHH